MGWDGKGRDGTRRDRIDRYEGHPIIGGISL